MNQIQLPDGQLDCGNYIGGGWRVGSGAARQVVSPYTGQVVSEFKESPADDVNRAVEGAQAGFQQWSAFPLKERCQVLFTWRQILLRDLNSISQVVALESGKTVEEAKAGLLKGIEVLEFATATQNFDLGGHMEVSRGVTCNYQRIPLGVVTGITPFNFPAMVPMWMIPIALVGGNAFLWKPSDKTPLTSTLIANTLAEAGLPPGALTVIQGGQATVQAIIDHKLVQAVGFVGSTPVAQSIYQRAANKGKRVLALGGAKNHIILLPDADPDVTYSGIADSFTGCAGQRCMAASVLVAVGDCEALIKGIVESAKAKKLGLNMGAIINSASRERLVAAITQAEQEGARILLDGRDATPPIDFAGGFWLGPTVIDLVRPGSTAACDELFGPILSVIRVENLSEALALENSNPYGNAASVFTRDGAMAQRVCQQARAGMIGVNIGVPVPREPFSFGGIQASKFGQGDITGPSGLDFWTERKKITVKWGAQSDHNWMS